MYSPGTGAAKTTCSTLLMVSRAKGIGKRFALVKLIAAINLTQGPGDFEIQIIDQRGNVPGNPGGSE
jgi:hypothetical protein